MTRLCFLASFTIQRHTAPQVFDNDDALVSQPLPVSKTMKIVEGRQKKRQHMV